MGTKKYMKGFSLVEAMLFLLIASLIVAATIPIVTKKHFRLPQMTNHGMYLCYKDDDDQLHEARWSGKYVLKEVIPDRVVESCTFIPPKKAPYFQVSAIGGGGGGGGSGYTGPSRSENYGEVQLLSPVDSDTGWTEETLKQYHLTPEEYNLYKGQIYAYAIGNSSGSGGALGYTERFQLKKCNKGRIFKPQMTPCYRYWRASGTGAICGVQKISSDNANCPDKIFDANGTCSQCTASKVVAGSCKTKTAHTYSCTHDAATVTQEYYIISCNGVQSESKTPVVGEQSAVCKTVSGPHTKVVTDSTALSNATCTVSSTSTYQECEYECDPSTLTTIPCASGCPNPADCQLGNITEEYLLEPTTESCGYNPESISKSSLCYSSYYSSGYLYCSGLYPCAGSGSVKDQPKIDYGCHDPQSADDPVECVDNDYQMQSAYLYKILSVLNSTYGGLQGHPRICYTEPQDLELGTTFSTATNEFKNEHCASKAIDIDYDFDKYYAKTIVDAPYALAVQSGDGLAYCQNGCEHECTDPNGSNPAVYQAAILDGKEIRSYSSRKGGEGRRRGVEYENGVPVGDTLITVANGEEGICTGEGVKGMSYTSANFNKICATTNSSAGYCLIHHHHDEKYGGDSVGEQLGKYRFQTIVDSDYLTYGAPGDPGELKTTIIRTLKGVDTTISIGSGGEKASNINVAGSPGGPTKFGLNGDLITAKGGSGGIAGVDATLDPLLPVYNEQDFNDGKFVKIVKGESDTKARAKGLATKIMNLVFDSSGTSAENTFMQHGLGGNGGGVDHQCWAGQGIYIFEGVHLKNSMFANEQAAKDAGGTNWVPESCYSAWTAIAPESGKPGALLIKW